MNIAITHRKTSPAHTEEVEEEEEPEYKPQNKEAPLKISKKC